MRQPVLIGSMYARIFPQDLSWNSWCFSGFFFFSYFSKHVICFEKSRFVFLIKHCQILCSMMTTITKICCDQLLKTSLTIMHLGILLTLNMFNWMTRGILCSSNIGPLLLPQSNILAKQWPINVYRGKGGGGLGIHWYKKLSSIFQH